MVRRQSNPPFDNVPSNLHVSLSPVKHATLSASKRSMNIIPKRVFRPQDGPPLAPLTPSAPSITPFLCQNQNDNYCGHDEASLSGKVVNESIDEKVIIKKQDDDILKNPIVDSAALEFYRALSPKLKDSLSDHEILLDGSKFNKTVYASSDDTVCIDFNEEGNSILRMEV